MEKPNRLRSVLSELFQSGAVPGVAPKVANGVYPPHTPDVAPQYAPEPERAPDPMPTPPSPSIALLTRVEGDLSVVKDALHQLAMMEGEAVELHRRLATLHQEMRTVTITVLDKLGEPFEGGNHASFPPETGS